MEQPAESILGKARRHSPEARAAAAVCSTLLAIYGGRLPVVVGAAIVNAILLFVTIWPDSRVTQILYSQCGPSLEIKQMTRRECLRAAGTFTLLAIGSLAIMLLSEWAAGVFDRPMGARSPWPLEFWFAVWGFFFFMGLVAAGYLLVRAPFRPGRLGSAEPDALEVRPSDRGTA